MVKIKEMLRIKERECLLDFLILVVQRTVGPKRVRKSENEAVCR